MMTERARVICADPPWKFDDKLQGEGRGAEKHYRVLELHDIMRFPLPPIEDNALLVLWRVSSQVEEAYHVIRAWGFTPKSEIVWVKEPKGGAKHDEHLHMGMGHYTRGAHETAVLATRGRFKVANRGIRSVFFAPVGEHSEKPDAFYTMIESLVGEGPFCELFGRKPRAGWHVHGDELPGGGYIWTPKGSVVVGSDPAVGKAAAGVVVHTNGTTNGKMFGPVDLDDVFAMGEAAAEDVRGDARVAAKISDGTRPRASVIAHYPPPTRGSYYAAALCAVCKAPQYVTESGNVCDNGHGGADSIPEGDPPSTQGMGGDKIVPPVLMLKRERYVELARMQGLLSADEARAEDAYVRLQYKAPGGWFTKQNLLVEDHLRRNPGADPNKVPITLADQGALVPPMENLSALALALEARRVRITLPELAALSPLQRDVARAFADQPNVDDVPAFLLPHVLVNGAPIPPVDTNPVATPAETPKAKRARKNKKGEKAEAQSMVDVADTIALANAAGQAPTAPKGSVGFGWDAAAAMSALADDPIIETGFWS